MMNEISRALSDVACNEEDLIIWHDELQDGFKKENFDHLSIKCLQRLEPNGSLRDILVDTRSIFQVIKDIGIGVTNVAHRLIDFGAYVNECKHHMINLVGSNKESIQLLKLQQQNLQIQNQCLETQNELLRHNILTQDKTITTIMAKIDKLSKLVEQSQTKEHNCQKS